MGTKNKNNSKAGRKTSKPRTGIENTVIIGIDPGNTSAGIAIRTVEGLKHHATVEPWHENGKLPRILPAGHNYSRLRVHVVCEEPPYTRKGGLSYKTRDGINRAAGMLVAMVRGVYRVPRTYCRFVTPGVWRSTLGLSARYGKSEDAKKISLEAAKELWPYEIFFSHDEAEAVLISEYGWKSFFGTEI